MKSTSRWVCMIVALCFALSLIGAKAPSASAAGTTDYIRGLWRLSSDSTTLLVDVYVSDGSFISSSNPLIVEAYTPNTNGGRWSYSSMSSGVTRLSITVPGWGHWRVKVSSGGGYVYEYEDIWVMPPYTYRENVMTDVHERAYRVASEGTEFVIFELGLSQIKLLKLLRIDIWGAIAFAALVKPTYGPYEMNEGDKWIYTGVPNTSNGTVVNRLQVFLKDAYGQYYPTPAYDQSSTVTYARWN